MRAPLHVQAATSLASHSSRVCEHDYSLRRNEKCQSRVQHRFIEMHTGQDWHRRHLRCARRSTSSFVEDASSMRITSDYARTQLRAYRPNRERRISLDRESVAQLKANRGRRNLPCKSWLSQRARWTVGCLSKIPKPSQAGTVLKWPVGARESDYFLLKALAMAIPVKRKVLSMQMESISVRERDIQCSHRAEFSLS